MKKNLLSLAVAGAILATASVASAATPDTFYIGAGLGYGHMDWNTPNPDVGQDTAYLYEGDTSGYGANFFAGYSFNEYFSLEGGYRYVGDFDGIGFDVNDKEYAVNFDVHGPEIAALLSFPISSNGSDIFLRGGAMYAFASHGSDTFSPIVGLGANINFTNNFGIRIGYDRMFDVYDNNHKDEDTYKVDFDVDYAYIALKYTFAKPAPAPAPTPVTQTVTTSYTLDANTTFGFDSDKVSPEGANAVGQILVDSQNANLQFVKYSVIGHTDRIGRAEYNQKLSERRAQAIANELVARGVQAQDISVSGVGSSQPATGSKCDNLNGKELINCVAPDRRVEIKVSGSVTKTETLQAEPNQASQI